MPFYEVIFENGTCSVMCCQDDDEAMSGVLEQHNRAKQGLLNGPQGAPSDRVVKVLKYDRHPNEWNPDNALPEDQLLSELKALIKASADENGVVAVGEFASEVRALTHPMVASDPHESNFRMKELSVIEVEQ